MCVHCGQGARFGVSRPTKAEWPGPTLGYKLHQDGSMECDAQQKRAEFINNSTEIRETFNFAHPAQILTAVNSYCSSFYGSMLYNLYGEEAEKLYRCWNTCVKLVWRVPRSTHTYLINDLLACDLPSIRDRIMNRYVKFVYGLLRNKSPEVRILANISGSDIRSTMGNNVHNLKTETKTANIGACPRLRGNLRQTVVPDTDSWRPGLLQRLLQERADMDAAGENMEIAESLIKSLCST